MACISQQALNDHRSRTFCSAPGMRLTSQDEAVRFINQRGFIFFWPYKGFTFPSLWTAAAGDRPVADEHDDPGHVTWGWKDGLLGKRQVFYARVLKHRNTFISLDQLPYFYALSPNYGSPEEDYLIDYEAGKTDRRKPRGLRGYSAAGPAGYDRAAQGGAHDQPGQRLAFQPRAG